MLPLFTTIQAWLVVSADRHLTDTDTESEAGRARGDAGQATAEYALVLVGAAAVALLLIGWAAKTDKIGKLLDTVVDQVAGRAK